MTENSIFEGAQFGDKFLTKNGKIAIFIMDTHADYVVCAVQGISRTMYYLYDGDAVDFVEGFDIVSKIETAKEY